MSGLYVSPTPRDNQPQIKRVPGFYIKLCIRQICSVWDLTTATVCRLRNYTCTPTVATAAPLWERLAVVPVFRFPPHSLWATVIAIPCRDLLTDWRREDDAYAGKWRHRIGESTYFDDLLYYSISKDTGDVRICTLKLYTREWETVRNESFLFSSSSIAALSSASSRYWSWVSGLRHSFPCTA